MQCKKKYNICAEKLSRVLLRKSLHNFEENDIISRFLSPVTKNIYISLIFSDVTQNNASLNSSVMSVFANIVFKIQNPKHLLCNYLLLVFTCRIFTTSLLL